MSYLLDTNILIRLVNQLDRQHLEAQTAIILLQNQGMEIAIVAQKTV